MSALINFPFSFLNFWFLEAPLDIIKFSLSFNKAVMNMLSVPVLIRTFFRPLKNEYREGLVGFSIGFGIFVKTCLLLTDFILITLLIILEFLILVGFIGLPVIAVAILFY